MQTIKTLFSLTTAFSLGLGSTALVLGTDVSNSDPLSAQASAKEGVVTAAFATPGPGAVQARVELAPSRLASPASSTHQLDAAPAPQPDDRVEAIERKMTALSAQLDALANGIAARSAEQEDTSFYDSRAIDEEIANEDELDREHLAELESRFLSGVSDAALTEEVDRTFESQWDIELLSNTELLDVQCVDAMCRIEAVHAGEEASERYVAHLGFMMPFDSNSTVAQEIDAYGTVTTVAFVAEAREF